MMPCLTAWSNCLAAFCCSASSLANSSGRNGSVSWVRADGQGRVFYTTLGHEPQVYWNPLFLRHLLAGIQFALGDLAGETASTGK